MIKTPLEEQKIRQAGRIGAMALKAALLAIRPGVTLLEINGAAEAEILKNNATPAFKKVPNYSFATCININEGIVHGIPDEYVIKEGDVVSVDLGAYFEGFNSDLAYTVEVGTKKHESFLKAGERALYEAIDQCKVGNRLGDVSGTIQDVVESAGYSVSRDLVGHGIGREMHEKPQIPCYGVRGTGQILKEGMVLAVEVIYQKGSPTLVLSDDAWTLETADKSVSALFEHDVLITGKGPEILTKL
ncbi:MAG: type I methionyl aminopeptidase [Patescibacteria group bacterium]|jgi:methionyl aminopeptidase